MDNVRAAYLGRTKIGCTSCRYCMPCPSGINIPSLFSTWNNVSLYSVNPKWDWSLCQIKKKGQGANRCVACGAYEATCLQHLSIIYVL